jgi:hypothetical protein
MVGLGREANGDAGRVMSDRFDMQRERLRESGKGARRTVAQAPI